MKIKLLLLTLVGLAMTALAQFTTNPPTAIPFPGNTASIPRTFAPGTNALYVAPGGIDSAAARGTTSAYGTLNGAAAAAQYGDVIYVSPGKYAGNNLAKNGVTWRFDGPACVVSNFANNNVVGSTNPIFTDIYGATNFSVLGYPTLIYHMGTNQYNPGIHDHPASIAASNAQYCIYLTNPVTTTLMQVDQIQMWGYGAASGYGIASLAGTNNITVNTLDTGSLGTPFVYVSTNSGGPYTYQSGTMSGIWWGVGDLTVHANKIGYFSQYGIWTDEQAIGGQLGTPGFAVTNNGYFTVNECDGILYCEANENSYRTWFNINWLNTSNSFNGYAAWFYGGYNYLRAQKISDAVVGCVHLDQGCSLWLNVDKLEASTNYLNEVTSGIPTNIYGGSNNLYAYIGGFAGAGANTVSNLNANIQLVGSTTGSTNIIYGQATAPAPTYPINATGTTNYGNTPGKAVVTDSGVTFTIYSPAGIPVGTNTSFTGTLTVDLMPGAYIRAASGLSGYFYYP